MSSAVTVQPIYIRNIAGDGLRIERTFPSILQGCISESIWSQFCNRVDKVWNDHRIFLLQWKIVAAIQIVIFSVLNAVQILYRIGWIGTYSITYNYREGYVIEVPLLSRTLILFYVSLGVAIIPTLVFYSIALPDKRLETINKCIKYYDEMNKKYPNIRIHYRKDRPCLLGLTTSVIVPQQSVSSVVDRLQELEDSKAVLTDEEYLKKRKEVLDSGNEDCEGATQTPQREIPASFWANKGLWDGGGGRTSDCYFFWLDRDGLCCCRADRNAFD